MKRWMLIVTLALAPLSIAAAEGLGAYQDNGNGSTTDSRTSLVWQRQDDAKERDWKQAMQYCEALTLAGSTDWRLPGKAELSGLLEKKRAYNNNINKEAFPNTKNWYWTQDPNNVAGAIGAWYVNFADGSVYWDYQVYKHFARCVRNP